MRPTRRPALPLNLGKFVVKRLTTGVHPLVVVSLAAIGLVTVYLLTNMPLASTASPAHAGQDVAPRAAVEISHTARSSVSEPAAPENLHRADVISEPASEQQQTKSIDAPVQIARLSENTMRTTADTFAAAMETAKPPVVEQPPAVGPQIEEQPASTAVSESISVQTDAQITSREKKKPRAVNHLDSLPWITAKVRKGDTLSQIFNRNHIGSSVAYKIARLGPARPLLKIHPGQEIRLKKNPQGELALLHYQLNRFETLVIQPGHGGYVAEVAAREPEIRLNNAKGNIYHSLLGAARKAGVSASTMYDFITIFGWQVDFSRDIRVGDQFSMIYEELYLDGEKAGDGNIIAAELVVSGKKMQAIRHEDEAGFTNYYAPDGSGIQGTFLRTPLKFGHVTSGFSSNRLHPVKKVWAAHKGVDYGAPRGTPILATGDGVVRYAGRKGGYGKTVILRHGSKYDTLYAHMSGYAKNIRVGAQVKQGDVIGYVGSTGLATGPHLHYEFRINGVHKNPVTVELPKSAPIPEKYKSLFQQSASLWAAELEFLQRIPLAQN